MSTQVLEKRPLGKTDITITPIGLGVWQFSQGVSVGGLMWRALPDGEEQAIIRAALDGGINWFDTAESYGDGRAERSLARGLLAAGVADGDVIIATKWFPFGRRAASIAKTFTSRQENLAPYHIDLHQVHFPYALSGLEAVIDGMTALAKQGAIRAVGVSNYNTGQMLRAHSRLQASGLPLASNQVKYNLLDRRIESNGVLEAARALGITIIAYSPLEMGLLSGKFHEDPGRLSALPVGRRLRLRSKMEDSAPVIAALHEIAAKYEASSAQVALNWLVSFHGLTVVAIPGASKPRHAAESAGAMCFTLSEEELARLDKVSRPFK